MAFTTTATIKSFGGSLLKLTHESKVLKCQMALNLYIPPTESKKIPVLWHLSGLTCTADNATEKGFFQYWAAKYGIAIVFPDTSPRGSNHPGEHDSWDFGSAAGFYLNATAEPWSENYNMESYVIDELPKALYAAYPELDSTNEAIQGHSMGGHGALSLFFKYPGKFKTASGFAPIANPINCPWGQKAFGGYLKTKEEWASHDSTELFKAYKGPKVDLFITVGLSDDFLARELHIDNFIAAAKELGREDEVTVEKLEGYDHSFFYVSSVAEKHISHAAKHLGVL
ncbi:Alpha/Beta hydrolase protein [Lipomyces oligophaga]|uniref:Alpha/Beta hydrolase protein n=1 Tax=Lipomyces oligophaga TaxID=45792 RepID=UPI0034CE6FF2